MEQQLQELFWWFKSTSTPTMTNETLEWDGSSWTSGGDLSNACQI